MIALQEKYKKEVAPMLAQTLGGNVHSVPKVEKIVVNMGVGNLHKSKELLTAVGNDLAAITGQAPSTRGARLSVASYGIRKGDPVGLMTTLRGERMYAFLERLFAVVLPRLRDFRGVSTKSFDKYGNYSLGLPEHTVFPELDPTKTAAARGIEITIVTSARDSETAKKLLESLGMPFEKGGAS